MALTKQEKLEKAKAAKAELSKEGYVVMNLEEKPDSIVDVISTGSMGLDESLGIGGLPKGRIVEIFGPESSGKTTLAIHVIHEAQKKGGLCAFIDAEHAFDKSYAESIGVQLNALEVNQPSSGEEGLEVADKLIQSGAYDVVVIDSVAALTPQAELDDPMGTSKMGLHARLMSQALRKLTANCHKANTLLIFINQLRDKIGVMFGDPSITTGGNALKFYASIRLDVRRSLTTENSLFNEKKEKIGNKTKVNVIKNKLAPPFRNAEFDIIWGKGIDKVGEVIDLCAKKGILKKWGKTITYSEVKYEVEQFEELVLHNEEFFEELRNKYINANKIQE